MPGEGHDCRSTDSGCEDDCRGVARLSETAWLARTPTDLHDHACINWRLPGSGVLHRWIFEKRGKRLAIGVEGALISNYQDVPVQAAVQGLGIHYAYDDRIHDLIAQGRLTRVLDDWSPTVPGLFLYYSNRHPPQPALRAFIDCLLDRDEASHDTADGRGRGGKRLGIGGHDLISSSVT
jgi:DNA-binding transcriptional LysR family regulator